MPFVSIRDSKYLLTAPVPPTLFLIDPYVPAQSRTLLHADYSSGKTPLTWEIAHCIGEGIPFMGLPTTRGKVLYVELDTPEIHVMPRIRQRSMGLSNNITWAFTKNLRVTSWHNNPVRKELEDYAKGQQWDLIIVNSLRQAHMLDEKASETVETVFGSLESLFPGAAILAVHHENKTPGDPKIRKIPKQAFAGSQAWGNLVQSQIQLVNLGNDSATGGEKVTLLHWKAQVGERAKQLDLLLLPGGKVDLIPIGKRHPVVEAFDRTDSGLSIRQRVTLVTAATGFSESTVRRALRANRAAVIDERDSTHDSGVDANDGAHLSP